MPCYENNAYYNPESFDPPLRKVAELEAFEPNYSFDILLVVQRLDDGSVWLADDSGCSCPTPFEGHDSLVDDFTRVYSWNDVRVEYERRFPTCSYRDRAKLSAIQHAVVGAFRRGA